MCAAEAEVSGMAPATVQVRKEFEDECDAEVEGRAQATSNSLVVVLSTEGGCSSTNRYCSMIYTDVCCASMIVPTCERSVDHA